MNPFAAGDDVYLPLTGICPSGRGVRGTVVFADHHEVRVRWSSGEIGILYFDGHSLADANRLEPIRAEVRH